MLINYNIVLGKYGLEGFGTKCQGTQILRIFGLGHQIMTHLIILATKARDAHIMDITGCGPCGVDKINISGLGGQNN